MKRFSAILMTFALLSVFLFPGNIAEASSLKCYKTGLHDTVCLTVDDGYGRAAIKKILKTLKDNQVNCTFFLIGDALKLNQDLWKQAVADGNQICYHTMHHRQLTRMSNKRVQADLDEWNKTLAEVIPGYQSPKLARLPGGGGENSKRLLELFAKNGYQVVGWSVDLHVNITKNPTRVITNHFKHLTKKNSIILIHFTMYNANALPHYIGWLKSHFQLSTVTEAIAS